MADELAGVLTDLGAYLIEQAYQAGEVVQITEMALGDGGGSEVVVSPDVTQLVGEFHRQLLDGGPDEASALGGSINFSPLPEDAGKWLREFGLFDSLGNLIVYAAYSPTQLPENPNMAVQFIISLMVSIMNIEAIEIVVNPEGTVTNDQLLEHEQSRRHPAAAEGAQGMIPIATPAMVAEGTDHSSALTPKTASDTFAREQHEHAIEDVLWLREELDQKADLEHRHEIDEVNGLPEALDSKFLKSGGAISGDFWRGDVGKRYGAALVLGQAADGKASLVILAKKSVGTALSKTGFIGRIIYDQGNATANLQSDFVDLAVSSAYQQNGASLLYRSGGSAAAAKIVEVTYTGEIHYALYRPATSAAAVVAVGHAFSLELPVLVPDATAYGIADVAVIDRFYHVSNKPTPEELGALGNTGGTQVLQGDRLTVKKQVSFSGVNLHSTDVEGVFEFVNDSNLVTGGFGQNTNTGIISIARNNPADGSYEYTFIQCDPVGGIDPAAAVVRILHPESLSSQGAAGASLTRKDWVDAHKWTAAAGNSDIVAGGYGQVGTYATMKAVDISGSDKNIGWTTPGSNLQYSTTLGAISSTIPSGTWKLLGYLRSGNDEERVSTFIRIDDAALFYQAFMLSDMAWDNAEHSYLTANVTFTDSGEIIPLTLSREDVETHGRWLFAMARDGEFGSVAEYVPPTPLEIATRDNPKLRQDEMAHATAMAQHYSMMGDQQLVSYWCGYYRLVYEMAQDPQWPLISAWPTRPE